MTQRLQLLDKIVSYYGDADNCNIRVHSTAPGSVIFDSLPTMPECDVKRADYIASKVDSLPASRLSVGRCVLWTPQLPARPQNQRPTESLLAGYSTAGKIRTCNRKCSVRQNVFKRATAVCDSAAPEGVGPTRRSTCWYVRWLKAAVSPAAVVVWLWTGASGSEDPTAAK